MEVESEDDAVCVSVHKVSGELLVYDGVYVP